MLFMTIVSWEPEKTEEMRKRLVEKGKVTGGKILGQWSAVGGGRSFRVVDLDDPKAGAAVCNIWNDIAKLEVIPIIESEQMMKLAASKK